MADVCCVVCLESVQETSVAAVTLSGVWARSTAGQQRSRSLSHWHGTGIHPLPPSASRCMLCRHADVGARTGGTGHGEMRDQFWRILLLWQAHANQHTVRAAVNTKVEHLTCLICSFFLSENCVMQKPYNIFRCKINTK